MLVSDEFLIRSAQKVDRGVLSALLLASQLDRVSIACGGALIVVSLGSYGMLRIHQQARHVAPRNGPHRR